MHDSAVPSCDVEDLEVAADVIAVRYEVALRRRCDAHVAERAALDDGVVVRAHEQASVHSVRKSDTSQLLGGERVSESRDRHEVDTVATLQLNYRVGIGQAIGRLVLLGHCAGGAAELQRREPIAMQRCGHVRTVRIERRTNRPADLTVRLDALADEMRAGRKNEIPGHALPHEMKVIAVVPHVLARAGDHVLLPLRVIRCGARMSRAADVRLRIESAERLRAKDRDSHGNTHPVGNDTTETETAHYWALRVRDSIAFPASATKNAGIAVSNGQSTRDRPSARRCVEPIVSACMFAASARPNAPTATPVATCSAAATIGLWRRTFS